MEVIQFDSELDVKDFFAEKPCVLALGFFDGVHKGHQALIEVARSIAKEKSLELAIMTFFPHPNNIIPNKKKIEQYLTPLKDKCVIFEKLNIEKVYIVNFNPNFSKVHYKQFIEDYIVGLQCKHVVAGYDFTFGYLGEGNMNKLQTESKHRFDVSVIDRVDYKKKKISSTAIRELLNLGLVHKIPDYLGANYFVKGTLKRQNNRLYIEVDDQYQLPAAGLYIVEIELKELSYIENCMISNSQFVRLLDDFTTNSKFTHQVSVTLHLLEKQANTIYVVPIQSSKFREDGNEKVPLIY